MATDEVYNSKEYKAWRYAVLVRDNFTCALTGAKGGDLQVHHIVPTSVAPHLQFVVSNGITLSKTAHDMVTGNEKQYEAMFKDLVAQKKMAKTGKTPKGKRTPSPGRKQYWIPFNPFRRY